MSKKKVYEDSNPVDSNIATETMAESDISTNDILDQTPAADVNEPDHRSRNTEANVDLNYKGACEFTENIIAEVCTECAEEYVNAMDKYDLIPADATKNKDYMCLTCNNVVVNDRLFTEVAIIPIELNQTEREYMQEYVYDEYEDDSVYIKLLKVKENEHFYGYLYDKTRPMNTYGFTEYPMVNAYCMTEPVTFEDMITVFNSFNFTVQSKDDGNEHLHVSVK